MRMYVNEIKIRDDSTCYYSEDPIDGLDEVGQMLIDSDNFSFAYLLDDGSPCSYLIFIQETWSMLHSSKDKEVVIDDELELEHFQDKLSYILKNVGGDNNCGREFVSAAKETFELK